MNRIRRLAAVTLTAAACLATSMAPAHAADPTPEFIMPSAPWLTVVNYYRAMARVPALTEDATMSAGSYNHSCYMLYNGMTHDEIPGAPGYTTSGDWAGNHGNVAASSTYGTSARQHIELWMTGPFHALGVLRPNLVRAGFGKCDNTSTSPWKSAATMNVIDGLNSSLPRPTSPILFPGDGMTTNLSRYVTETPSPLTFCGWTGSAGLPVIAMMPEAVSSVTTSMTGPNGPVQLCTVFTGNTSGIARDILAADNAVSVIPRDELVPGKYTVSVTTQARSVTWSFTVDPTAATGIMPIPQLTPVGPASRFDPIPPFRFADSRIPLRINKLLAYTPKRIVMAGVAGIPADATAVSANFTVTNTDRNGHLTVYACADEVPVVSTLNFFANDTVPNSGIFPLKDGALCVQSPSTLHLVIDVTGYIRPTSTSMYNGMTPTAVVNSATGLGASGYRGVRSVLSVNVGGADGVVPSDATAVALNIAGVQPLADGFITAYPCDMPRPEVSNVNAVVGSTTQNLAIVPMAADGTICFYTLSSMNIRVDVLGYFSTGSGALLTPANPTRFIDTRDQYRPLMNFGLGGERIPVGSVQTLALAGQRGIPSGATAVAINVTILPLGVGTITVWGCGSTTNTISMSFKDTKVVATGMLVKLGAAGDICLRSDNPVHVVIDIDDYFT